MRPSQFFRNVLAFGLMGLLVAVPSWAAASEKKKGYALLALAGENVKWGTPVLGEPATIHYAFVKSRTVRQGARNCRITEPFPARLSKGNVSYSKIVAEFRLAFAAWESVAAVRFVLVDDAENADLLLGVQAKPSGVAYADVIRESGSHSDTAPIQSAAICINPEMHWETGFDGDSRSYDIRYVATHEIGHVIGLDHMRAKDRMIMSFKYREIFRVPQPGDIAGARLLYGPAPILAASLSAGGEDASIRCGGPDGPRVVSERQTAGHEAPPSAIRTDIDQMMIDCVDFSAGPAPASRTSADP